MSAGEVFMLPGGPYTLLTEDEQRHDPDRERDQSHVATLASSNEAILRPLRSREPCALS